MPKVYINLKYMSELFIALLKSVGAEKPSRIPGNLTSENC